MKHKLIRITTIPRSWGLIGGQMRYMEQAYQVIGVAAGDDQFADMVEKERPQRAIPINMTREFTPLKDIRSLLSMIALFRQENPFIVHTHTPKAGLIGMLAAWICRVPIRMHTVAGLPLLVSKGGKRKILEAVERLTYYCATRVYPNSFKMLDIILDLKLTTKDKLKVIANGSSNGIDTEYFSPSLFSEEVCNKLKQSLGIQEQDFVFVFIGRLVGDKGVNELVEAFEELNYPDTKLLLVGRYEDQLDPLNWRVKESIKSNSRILEVGWQADVRPFLRISNVLAFPSYREGFPNVVMQAGAMSLPAIVTDINGCNEIIINEKNGLIIPPKNKQALLTAMGRILREKDLRDLMIKQARFMITSRYEQKNVWSELLKEYKILEVEAQKSNK